jgi:hypothetical protein
LGREHHFLMFENPGLIQIPAGRGFSFRRWHVAGRRNSTAEH